MSSLDKFDPNANDKHPFASYVPGRHGQSFKVHTQRSHAISAMTYRSYGGAILYEWCAGRWEEVVRLDPEKKSPNCDLCGDNLLRTNRYDSSRVDNVGKQRLVRHPGGKLAEPLRTETVCPRGCGN